MPESDRTDLSSQCAALVLSHLFAVLSRPRPAGHLEQINNDFFSWQNDVDGGWVRARWDCRDKQNREKGKSWEDLQTIAFCDRQARYSTSPLA